MKLILKTSSGKIVAIGSEIPFKLLLTFWMTFDVLDVKREKSKSLIGKNDLNIFAKYIT